MPWTKLTAFVLCTIPGILLGWQWWHHSLGINPLERLLRNTGSWALIFLLITLAITPGRRLLAELARHCAAPYGKRLGDWNWLIKLRRMIGLTSFCYAASHFVLYAWLDQGLDWQGIVDDILDRPFIFVGLAALLLLTPVAATSNDMAMRWLGKYWRPLHRSVYVIAILSMLHYWLQIKKGVTTPLPYTVILVFLLGYRVGAALKKDRDTGMETPPR